MGKLAQVQLQGSSEVWSLRDRAPRPQGAAGRPGIQARGPPRSTSPFLLAVPVDLGTPPTPLTPWDHPSIKLCLEGPKGSPGTPQKPRLRVSLVTWHLPAAPGYGSGEPRALPRAWPAASLANIHPLGWLPTPPSLPGQPCKPASVGPALRPEDAALPSEAQHTTTTSGTPALQCEIKEIIAHLVPLPAVTVERAQAPRYTQQGLLSALFDSRGS